MLSIRRATRALPIIAAILASAVLLHPAFTAEAPRGAGIAALAAQTPTRVARGVSAPAAGADARTTLLCSGPEVARCFEISGMTRSVNVGAFFDRRGPTSESHFFLKYFEPPAASRVRVEGFAFQANRGGIQLPSCGVVRTSRAAPTFPRPEQLASLQAPDVVSEASSQTCVDLADLNFVLEPTESAWLVLQFPNPADTLFVGVAADGDATDHPCDFFTRDSGEYWYRPDPQQSPLDWSFTVHYSAVTTKVRKRVPWSVVKGLHH
jgi:hypothetical protein